MVSKAKRYRFKNSPILFTTWIGALCLWPLLAFGQASTSNELPPLPKMKDGLRGIMLASVITCNEPQQMESVQSFYGIVVNAGPKASWSYQGQPDVHMGRSDVRGIPAVREVYEQFLVSAEKRRAAVNKPLIAGRYIGAQTLRTVEQLEAVNRWPSHNAVLANFTPDMLKPAREGWEKTDFAQIDYRKPAARRRAIQEFIAEGRGERGAPKPEMLHFDEVGYLEEDWPGLVEVLSEVKRTLNAEGVLVSINLGGYSWRRPADWAPTVLEQLPRMANAIQIEGIPDRAGGGLKESELKLQIKNLRSILAQGMGFEFLPFIRPSRVLPYRIKHVDITTEGDTGPVGVEHGRPGDKKLLITLTTPAACTSPLGSSPFEMFEIGERSGRGNVRGAPVEQWTCYPHPKEFDKLFAFRRENGLAKIETEIREKNPSFRWNDLAGQPLYDLQSLYRVQAAFALVVCRDFEDSLWCHYQPQAFRPDTYAKKTGKPAHDWMRWPELLGPPQELDSRIISTTPDGQVQELRRKFKNAELIWYVDAGVVRFGPP